MKLKRCESQHLYPADRYSECPFCAEEKGRTAVKISAASEEHEGIESADNIYYPDRILTKKDLDEMREKAKREYLESHPLHVNTRSENIKQGANKLLYNLSYYWEEYQNSWLGRLMTYFGDGDD